MTDTKRVIRKTRNHFDETAENYDNSFDGKYVKPMYDYVLNRLNKEEHGKILDVGCGTGNILMQLVNGKRKLFGIDLSEEMVKVAKTRLSEDATIITADAKELPFENGTFDILLCNASFHHYPEPKAVLLEMKRVLKNQGKLLIGEGYAFQPFRLLLNIYFHFANTGDYHSYGKNELRRLLMRTGFEVEKIERKGMRIYYEAKQNSGKSKEE